MKIINWCSGGLGNRLKPLASCAVIAKETGRQLGIMWQPTMRCQTHFHDLFKNDIEEFDNESIKQLDSVHIYTERPYISHDANLNNLNGLLTLSGRFDVSSLSETSNIRSNRLNNIITYSNDYLAGYDQAACNNYLKELTPVDYIKEEVETFCRLHSIDKSFIGVHCRGTDFESGGSQLQSYMTHMAAFDGKFFVCSDSLEYEQAIKNTFGDRVVFRQKRSYVYKENPGNSWTNNVQTPKDSVLESLIDLYILAKTNFQIYNKNSTFAHLAFALS
jgi:hypothetical protein